MSRLLFVSPDQVGPEMAGPGIRYSELAGELSRSHDVTLAVPIGSNPVGTDYGIAVYDPARPATLRRLLAPRQVVVAPPLPPRLLARLTGEGRKWIVDLYDPELFSGLEYQKALPRLERMARQMVQIDGLAFAVRAGSAFVCANERQRDMWLGFIGANRRLDSDRYSSDPELRTLIDVVPFGVPETPPKSDASRFLRDGIFPGEARIMVWNGGLWDWLDPLTVIRALAILREDDSAWRLAFLGTGRRPGNRAAMQMEDRALRLADELGLREDGSVYFHSRWTPYNERGSLLLECDIGVSAHPSTLEARFAHRSRMVDFLWTRLPIVCTEGDEWAYRIATEGLGETVAVGDPEAFALAATRVARKGPAFYSTALSESARGHTWHAAAQPLRRLVEVVPSIPLPKQRLIGAFYAWRHSAAMLAGRRWPRS